MERGAPLSHYQLPKPNSGLNLDQQSNSIPTLTGSIVDDKNKSGVGQQQPCMAREQDQYMPIANVIRIMRRILPSHAKISDDAKETIQECVSEYISFVTGEANERCQREQRKTITAEDILYAMSKLGFDDYVGPLNVFINRYREFETDRGCSLRGESSSFKPAFGGSGIGFHGPSLGPPPPGAYGYGMLDQSLVIGGGGGRYYQNGSGQDGSVGGEMDGDRQNRRALITLTIALMLMFTTLRPILNPPADLMNASSIPKPGITTTEADFRVKQVARKSFWAFINSAFALASAAALAQVGKRVAHGSSEVGERVSVILVMLAVTFMSLAGKCVIVARFWPSSLLPALSLIDTLFHAGVFMAEIVGLGRAYKSYFM